MKTRLFTHDVCAQQNKIGAQNTSTNVRFIGQILNTWICFKKYNISVYSTGGAENGTPRTPAPPHETGLDNQVFIMV